MNAEFIRALDVIQEEKSIDKEELIQSIEAAISTAYKKIMVMRITLKLPSIA